MDNTINFGIDLGTTNSAIARFVKGEVQVFNNPSDYGRATLPSVVGFKKDKIIVGTKAKELLEKDSLNVKGAFKRRMGTTESYKIKATGQSVTPVELSAMVLKELKTFLPAGETLGAAVLTIPASFDTIQSNATKEAGQQAGLDQVVLLQEPVAASLAYANMKKTRELEDGRWLVYDLGGGTFDVALVQIQDGEMRVLDHEGDNYLGGTDFDRIIVEKLVVPKLRAQFSFGDDLLDQMQSGSGDHNISYYKLLRRAEEAKILLSNKPAAEIVVDGLTDDDDNDVDTELTITRSEFNDLIKDAVDRTLTMVRTILTRNNLRPSDLLFTLMVGGSTYIPFVRERVGEALGVPVNCDIDPTTAVAVGAAYYAATKPRERAGKANGPVKAAAQLRVKTSYEKASREAEELFGAKVTGDISGLSYRITRLDGGFDSGLKRLTSDRISEDLPLVSDTFNQFRLAFYDPQGNEVMSDLDDIAINSGFAIGGQPLPEDICLEVDDDDHPGQTKLIPVFQRMTPLPARKLIARTLNRSLTKGSEDVILINIREGRQTNLPEANKLVGHLRISGRQLGRDVSRGSEIEIALEMSESRDLQTSVYITMSDQEFKGVFEPKIRVTTVNQVQTETNKLSRDITTEIKQAEEREDFEMAAVLKKLRKEASDLTTEAGDLTTDDVTDKKYQLEDRKRQLAERLHETTRDKRLAEAKIEYQEEKAKCTALVNEHGTDQERKYLRDVEMQEPAAFAASNPAKIAELTNHLNSIAITILWRVPEFLRNIFGYLENNEHRMSNATQAVTLLESGRAAIQQRQWERLRDVNQELFGLMPNEALKEMETTIGF